jgi:hypothetical protein
MALDQPFPDLDELLATIGAAGQRLGGLNASEGACIDASLKMSSNRHVATAIAGSRLTV